MKYIIISGLPGSGKTSLAEKLSYDKYKSFAIGTQVIHTDNYNKDKYDDIFEYIKKEISLQSHYSYYKPSKTIIEGLFTTNEHIIDVINKSIKNTTTKIEEIKIIQFEENREQCIINDKNRREKNSEIDIKNLPYEKFDIELIKSKTEITNISLETAEVVTKNEIFIAAENEDITIRYEDSPYIYSDRWVVGGEWYNCWGDGGGVNSETPANFTNLDNLLNAMCPNLSFLQYKKIWNQCVEIQEDSESGYYGSYEDYNQYKCNLNELYNIMCEMNLIN